MPCNDSTAAIRDVESDLAAMKTEHDPFASHSFVSRRNHDRPLSFNTACELGFRGGLGEWKRSWEELRGGERLQHADRFAAVTQTPLSGSR